MPTKIGQYFLDALQGASNAAASTVSGPVDAIAWGLRKAGVPVGDAPVGGSEWMGRAGLTRAPESAAAGAVGEIAGALLPTVVAAKAPQIAAGILRAGENLAAPRTMGRQMGAINIGGATPEEMATAQANAARPRDGGGLGLRPDNTPAERMAAMGMERGWYRGGPAPVNGAPTGPWYTSIQDEAADYAKRSAGEVREYALPASGNLKFQGGYPNRLANDLANLLDADGNKKAAEALRSYYADGSPISGMEAYKFLQRNVGDGAPEAYLSRLRFNGVDGVNSPNYRLMLPNGAIRDAERAAFDPMRKGERNIFAGAAFATPIAALFADDRSR